MQQVKLQRTYDIVATIQIVTRTNGKYYAEIVRNVDDLWNENEEYECWIEKDGQLMCEPVNTEEEYDTIINVFREYIIEKGVKYARKCTCCGKGMNEGFFADYEYFCDNDCLYTEFPPTIWEKVAEEDSDNYYWTEWEDEEDYQYILFNNQLVEL
jgi:hypothetical protein